MTRSLQMKPLGYQKDCLNSFTTCLCPQVSPTPSFSQKHSVLLTFLGFFLSLLLSPKGSLRNSTGWLKGQTQLLWLKLVSMDDPSSHATEGQARGSSESHPLTGCFVLFCFE